jgi:sec-independent protein translocase protein TatC
MRWAILIIAFLSALLTPTPDIFNMSLFALPTMGLYLLGIGGSFLVQWLRRRRPAAEDAAESQSL